MTKALDSVKSAVTSTASVATSAAKGIGAAFSAVLGPIGIAAKAFEILAPLIDTQSEELLPKLKRGTGEEIKKNSIRSFEWHGQGDDRVSESPRSWIWLRATTR